MYGMIQAMGGDAVVSTTQVRQLSFGWNEISLAIKKRLDLIVPNTFDFRLIRVEGGGGLQLLWGM